jgi:hypothetical protein
MQVPSSVPNSISKIPKKIIPKFREKPKDGFLSPTGDLIAIEGRFFQSKMTKKKPKAVILKKVENFFRLICRAAFNSSSKL